MQSVRIISMVVFLIFYANILKAQDINFKNRNVDIIGRGEVKWDGDNIIVDDCLIATQKQCPASFEINLDPKYSVGKTLTIEDKNNSDKNCYIQSTKLNGKEYSKCWIGYEDIVSRGRVDFGNGG